MLPPDESMSDGHEDDAEERGPRCAQRLEERHAKQASKRAEHGRKARAFAVALIPRFNEHYRQQSWSVVTTLLGQYLTVADGSSRFEMVRDRLPVVEAMSEYWSLYAPMPWAAQLCFRQAFQTGMAVSRGLWEDPWHDLYPSRTPDADPSVGADGVLRRPHRDIAIGLDGAGQAVTVKQRSKWELYAASYVESRGAGAWLGYLATSPPEDWSEARMLGNEHWGPEWGHPACILPARAATTASLFQCSIYPMLPLATSGSAESIERAVSRIWRDRKRRGELLDEPSFSVSEAIKLLGAVVGICPQSEAAARNVYRFCYHRARAGALSPAWSLRLCRHEACQAPLFLHDVVAGKGDAPLPSYCRSCGSIQDSHRRQRSRRRAKLREEALKSIARQSGSVPSLKLPPLL